jgi:hypothetical protein
MKTRLQHFFHPLNLWCRVGGKFTFAFRLYETYCWQPVLRRWLGNGNGREIHLFSGDKDADKCSAP